MSAIDKIPLLRRNLAAMLQSLPPVDERIGPCWVHAGEYGLKAPCDQPLNLRHQVEAIDHILASKTAGHAWDRMIHLLETGWLDDKIRIHDTILNIISTTLLNIPRRDRQ